MKFKNLFLDSCISGWYFHENFENCNGSVIFTDKLVHQSMKTQREYNYIKGILSDTPWNITMYYITSDYYQEIDKDRFMYWEKYSKEGI
jgi:myosin-crossreactive antigen